MIFTTYFDNLTNLPKNIIPIAICGKCPTDWCGLKYTKLAPKKRFWLEWEKNKNNDYYKQHFKDEVLSNLNVLDVLNELYELLPKEYQDYIQIVNCLPWAIKDFHIALVCYEEPNEFCHRHLVADWVNKELGYELIQEFKNSNLEL